MRKSDLATLIATIPDSETRSLGRKVAILIVVAMCLAIATHRFIDYSEKPSLNACEEPKEPEISVGLFNNEKLAEMLFIYTYKYGHNAREFLLSEIRIASHSNPILCTSYAAKLISFAIYSIFILVFISLSVGLWKYTKLKIFARHDFTVNVIPIKLYLSLLLFIALIHFGYYALYVCLTILIITVIVKIVRSSNRIGILAVELRPMYSRTGVNRVQTQMRTIHSIRSHSILALANAIENVTDNDFERVYAIHLWLSENMVYDTLGVLDGSHANSNAHRDFSLRKGSCHGFARVFSALAEELGLDVRVIYGYARVKTLSTWEPHNWVSIRICEKQWYFDPTWDSGYVNPKTFAFTRKLGKFQYFASSSVEFHGTHSTQGV